MDSLSVSLAAIQEEEKWSAKFMIKLGGEEFSSFFICLLDPKMKQAYRDFVNHKRNLFEDFNAAYGSTSLYWLSETVIRLTVIISRCVHGRNLNDTSSVQHSEGTND